MSQNARDQGPEKKVTRDGVVEYCYTSAFLLSQNQCFPDIWRHSEEEDMSEGFVHVEIRIVFPDYLDYFRSEAQSEGLVELCKLLSHICSFFSSSHNYLCFSFPEYAASFYREPAHTATFSYRL